jgi:hypothetical protein
MTTTQGHTTGVSPKAILTVGCEKQGQLIQSSIHLVEEQWNAFVWSGEVSLAVRCSAGICANLQQGGLFRENLSPDCVTSGLSTYIVRSLWVSGQDHNGMLMQLRSSMRGFSPLG